ncbi:MAG TPA: hypothetical protein VHJ39_17575 [Solirubrobacteraceae bacterium]|jgi:hypothetical protein|nr:hypothetical protein [Solirubrobacteraceae bacterium]
MRQPSEEEIRALEAEMAKLTVDDVLLQTIVTLLNLGARKAGLAEGSEPDLPQVRDAIEAARALMPIVEQRHGEELAPVKDALSRLQMAYVQMSGPQAQEGPRAPNEPATEEGPGPAQQSGRLWVPGNQ